MDGNVSTDKKQVKLWQVKLGVIFYTSLWYRVY